MEQIQHKIDMYTNYDEKISKKVLKSVQRVV